VKISIKSINRYLSKPMTTDQIVAALGRSEIEIEEVITTEPFDRQIVVGQVTALGPHPQADRLQIAQVAVGKLSKQPLQIVCGAPNIAIGQTVVLAMTGAVLPDGTVIRAATIRGQQSNGMLCSARELGISDDHGGIMVLDHPALPGQILCDIWQTEDQLDIKTHPNRWDHQSWVGVVREISASAADPAYLLAALESPENTYTRTISHNVKKTGKCQRFITVKLRVKNDVKTPTWLVENLVGAGLRSVNAVVDITNFVMLELGQPSHAYDAVKVRGDLRVVLGSPAQTLTTIDGVARQLAATDLIIADESGPVGLAGVIGGQSSEIETTTQEIILEVATFDKTTVRRTALRHGLRTEASARFERGLPSHLPQLAADRLIELLREICQAEILVSPVDLRESAADLTENPPMIGLSVRRAERLLGMVLDEAQVLAGLRRLGLGVEHFSLSREARRLQTDGLAMIDAAKATKPDPAAVTSSIYRRIGLDIGQTVAAQLKKGHEVGDNRADFKPGDILFAGDSKQPKIGLYIGKNKLLTATAQGSKTTIEIVSVSALVNDPHFRGARRYLDNFNHILAITIPWWRADLQAEEDIVEEIAKIIGYDKLPTTLPQLPPQNTTEHQVLPQALQLKQQLVALGLFEIMTYSFVGQQSLSVSGTQPGDHLSVANPLSREQAYLRSSFLPSHLDVLQRNMRYPQPFGWFEIAKLFRKQGDQATFPATEIWRIAIMFTGVNSLDRTKNVINWLIERSREPYHIKPQQIDWFIPGRGAVIRHGQTVIGRFGQLQPTILPKKMSNQVVSYAELDLLPFLHQTPIQTKPVPAYQLIERDLSLELSDEVLWQDVAGLLQKHAQVYQTRLIDQYRDQHNPTKHTLTVRISLDCGPQPAADEIQKVVDGLIRQLKAKLQAEIR